MNGRAQGGGVSPVVAPPAIFSQASGLKEAAAGFQEACGGNIIPGVFRRRAGYRQPSIV
jgi:hypothetical protein